MDKLIYKGLKENLPEDRADDKFYLTTDTRELYFGSRLYTEAVRWFENEKPENPTSGILYIDSATYDGWMWGDDTWVRIFHGVESRDAHNLPDGGTTGQILVKQSDGDGDATWKDFPAYNGAYEVTPLAGSSVTLETQSTFLDRDIVVREIPVYETENNSGGYTVIIGG